jgi:hypothetical protein
MKKSNKKQIEMLAKRAAEVLAKLDEMKPLYNEIDKITEQLVAAGVENIAVGVATLHVVDNFAAKNTVFKTTSVKRFEIKKVG